MWLLCSATSHLDAQIMTTLLVGSLKLVVILPKDAIMVVIVFLTYKHWIAQHKSINIAQVNIPMSTLS